MALRLGFLSLLFGGALHASPICNYVLDHEAYDGHDLGYLHYAGKVFRCGTVRIGDSERDLCWIPGPNYRGYEYLVAFDGAEDNFSVFSGLDSPKELCHGVATENGRP